MEYFGHDTNCLSDPNLKKVRSKYKAAGLGIYWHCNEAIALHLDPPNGIDCVLNEDIHSIAHELYESEDFVKEVLEYFVTINLFTKTEDGRYQNLKLLKRLNRYSRLKLAQLAKKLGLKINMDTMSTQEVLNMLTLSAKDAPPLNLTKPNLTPSNSKNPTALGAVNLADKIFAFKSWYGKNFKQILNENYLEKQGDDKHLDNLLAQIPLEDLKRKTRLALDNRDKMAFNLSTLVIAINRPKSNGELNEIGTLKRPSQPQKRVADDEVGKLTVNFIRAKG